MAMMDQAKKARPINEEDLARLKPLLGVIVPTILEGMSPSTLAELALVMAMKKPLDSFGQVWLNVRSLATQDDNSFHPLVEEMIWAYINSKFLSQEKEVPNASQETPVDA